ncbi:MAG TPA: thioredoxin domain-containing protein [Gemmatimonadales bacterium]|nr:thioredoxin domain-containing protein [Gemmatimonadales bacterium]
MRATGLLVLGGLVLGAGLAMAADNSEQLIKYYRKKNNLPPASKAAVTGLHDSTSIKGAKEGTLEIGEGPSAQRVGFIASPDMRYVVFAAAEDVTVDPSKAVMSKIDLKGQPSKGPANAKVTIVEYSDFQCPFCSRAYNTMDKQVLKDYGHKVRFYYKHYPLPFHPFAKPAAIAAECAKQQKPEAFWKLYSDFFENQGQMTPENVKEKATQFLQGTGIDMAKWNDCFDNKRSAPAVDAQMAEGTSVGVTGTPGFIINGRLVSGAQPYENFKNIIDDELAAPK